MNLSSKIGLSIAALSVGLMFTNSLTTPAVSNTTGAPASRTGSPGDGANCTSCHAGTAATVSGLINSGIPATGYIPGQTYTITGSITQSGKTKFGFEISPQNTSGVKKGTLVVTNSTATQLISTGKYITHKTAGTSFPSGTASWSFDWIAPEAGSGDVTFYGAFNISNSNSSTSGDIIKLSTLTVQEDLATGVNELYAGDIITVYPNPVVDKLFIRSLSGRAYYKLSIINIEGKIVKEEKNLVFDQPVDLTVLSKGYYIVKIETERGITIKKIIKD